MLQCLLAGILGHMRETNPNYPNFFSKEDPDFTSFHITLDNLFKSLRRADGIGTESSLTESREEENQLWTAGILNVSDPKGLLHCVFFYNEKCFCLRGGQEHRELRIPQLKRLQNPDRYVYYENASKNRPGGLMQSNLDHKVVSIVANPAVGD